MDLKRTPTELEARLLICAQAIDRMGTELASLTMLSERMLASLSSANARLEKIEKRDEWVDHYREHARDGLDL